LQGFQTWFARFATKNPEVGFGLQTAKFAYGRFFKSALRVKIYPGHLLAHSPTDCAD
jgi:hypothetical protein